MLRKWVVYWHGEGAPHQADVYSCRACKRLVTHRVIADGGCRCGGNTIQPKMLRAWHMAQLVLLPWTIHGKAKA